MKSTISQEKISETAVRLGIPDHPFVARRIARAFDLVATDKVNEVSHDDGFYRVHSQYDDKIYTVELNHGNPSCTCPDNERTIFCKHSIASMLVALEAKPKARAIARAKLVVYDDTFDKRNGKRHSKYGRWIVNDYKVRKGYVVYSDEHGKLHCACGKKNCRHCKAIRKVTAEGVPTETVGIAPRDDGKRIENECGTSEAKSLQDELNGNNGTGDNNLVHHQLDTSNPFQECEQLDIDQIEGRSNGDLVHVLSNGEYVISYRGIMKLAEQHGVTFEASRHDATRTVIAYGRCGSNSRASGKPINGSEMTAIELAKRNTARQLLPLPEIKALEHKAKFEGEFDWQVAKRKCLEIVPDFTFDILLTDLVRDGKIAQKHSSDYSRKEWLVIFDACKRDADTNGHDDDDGAGDTASSDRFAECRDAARAFVRFQWLKSDMLKEGVISDAWTGDDIAKLKSACEIDKSLFGKKLSHWTVEIEPNHGKWAYQRRYRFWLSPMTRRCFWCGRSRSESILPDTMIYWGRYEIKASLCLECSRGEHPNGEDLTQKFDNLYHGVEEDACYSQTRKELPDTMDEFVERCKEMESEVDDPAPMVEGAQMDCDGKRKLQMDKKLRTWLVEADGTLPTPQLHPKSFPTLSLLDKYHILYQIQALLCHPAKSPKG